VPDFPDYSDSAAQAKIGDLVRLLDSDLSSTQYMDAPAGSELLMSLLSAYRDSLALPRWQTDPYLQGAGTGGARLGLVLASAFDLLCNVEYCHGRMVSNNWIYCRSHSTPYAYFSFLKQCPQCSVETGLEKRLTGAQHKPSSHHIGEITTTICTMILRLLSYGSDKPLTVDVITKQNHDVDAVAYDDQLVVLLEIKASPMVTFPIRCELPARLFRERGGERVEYKNHSLVDIQLDNRELSLYMPHRDWKIPLGVCDEGSWPYSAIANLLRTPESFLEYLSGWMEIYLAYSVPKTRRQGRDVSLAYLANGWGDEIDSNKTKPGLGRTDDIKKGTYQLLKFGAYYRDDESRTRVRGSLVANLDPMFMRSGYLEKLEDIRWARSQDFSESGDGYWISSERLRYLYDAIVAFNSPSVNDPMLLDSFNFDQCDAAISAGHLDHVFADPEIVLRGD
jgi:hypothetical protein